LPSGPALSIIAILSHDLDAAMAESRILIVGAGPTGLLLANLLGDAGVPCLLVDRRANLPAQSRAIGVTPPSLELLAELGLAESLVARGVPVRDAIVSDGRRRLGSVSFCDLPGPFPFILAVPQRETMGVLEDRLPDLSRVEFRKQTELVGLTPLSGRVVARLRDLTTGRELEEDCACLIGCDGNRSTVREATGFRWRRKRYAVSFIMADFAGRSGFGDDAVLFFTPAGAVESFPLPCGRRRWIAQTSGNAPDQDADDLVDRVREQAGVDLAGVNRTDFSAWRPERLVCRRFTRGRVLLCGDAAHVMSPIGGQGMNTGLADAAFACGAICRSRGEENWDALCRWYDRRRRRAFTAAASRAATGMWIGTRTGFAGRVRAGLLRYVLLTQPFARWLPRHFAMLTIPNGRSADIVREALRR
jgi:2-polyprenyl-6-methoxyphenol hydroxylase-like FAD-dependent oxidoreductase